MTELMKRYEAETDEMATWRWHDRDFLTDDQALEQEKELEDVPRHQGSTAHGGDARSCRRLSVRG